MRKLGILLLVGLGSARLGMAQDVAAWVAAPPAAEVAGSGGDAAARPAFAYAPPAPVGGRLKSVVEVTASGLSSVTARVDGEQRWQLEKVASDGGLLPKRQLTDAALRQRLQAYIEQLRAYGVAGQDIHFVAGAEAVQAAGPARLVASLRALGYPVGTVSPAQEGALGLRAALPAAYADEAFLVSIEPGSTRISWLDHGVAEVRTAPGTAHYQQCLAKAAGLADLRAQAAQVPADHRQTCFVLGSVAAGLAGALRQGQEPYTVLGPATEDPRPTTPEQQAGQAIYAALAEATGCQQFVFVWDGGFPLGYLLTK